MLKLINKDLKLIFGSKVNLLLFMGIAPMIIYLMSRDGYYAPHSTIIITLVHVLTTFSFNYDINFKSHILFQSLPLRNYEIVISKYLLIFINFVIVNILIFIIVWIMKTLGLIDPIYKYFSIDNIRYTLIVSMISLSITLPAMLRLHPKIANFVGIFIMITTLNTSNFYIFKLSPNNSNIYNLMDGLGFNLGVFAIMGVSIFLSLYLYKNREF